MEPCVVCQEPARPGTDYCGARRWSRECYIVDLVFRCPTRGEISCRVDRSSYRTILRQVEETTP